MDRNSSHRVVRFCDLIYILKSFKVDYKHTVVALAKIWYLHELCQFSIQLLNYTVITFLRACKHCHGLSLSLSHTWSLSFSLPRFLLSVLCILPDEREVGTGMQLCSVYLFLVLSLSHSFLSCAHSLSLSHLLPRPLSLSPHSALCSAVVSWRWRAGEGACDWGNKRLCRRRLPQRQNRYSGGTQGLWISTCSFQEEMRLWHLWTLK